jgi:hypothetical protein
VLDVLVPEICLQRADVVAGDVADTEFRGHLATRPFSGPRSAHAAGKKAGSAGRSVCSANCPSEEGVPEMFGGLVSPDLINVSATNRTKPNMNPPTTVPYITEAGT